VGDVHYLPALGREFFLDESGTVLRVSWHLDRRLANMSVWRGDRCTETFQLAAADAARLIAYLADGLASAASAPTARVESERSRFGSGIRDTLVRAAQRVAGPRP
jgi:hypothetical protein